VETIQHVRKTDLARNTRRIIHAVQRGQTAVIESHGQPEVVIIDIIDYHILRAVMRYYAQPPQLDAEIGLSDQAVAELSDSQARYNLVLSYYLAGAINLGRAAELLDLPWLDLRTRCLRLDVPLRIAPADLAEVRADVETAANWIAAHS
jgi:hypothetical protein